MEGVLKRHGSVRAMRANADRYSILKVVRFCGIKPD
jgi:hypothetical protein